MVEHIGFEPMTSSMPWKRASQLRQCPKYNASNCTLNVIVFLVVMLVATMNHGMAFTPGNEPVINRYRHKKGNYQ